ncbi:MAG TPA: nucleoside diphosphate kinase regulator [Nannocystis sp.]
MQHHPPPLILARHDVVRLRRLLDRPGIRDTEAAEMLEEEIERAEVVEPEALPPNVVSMNSRVRLLDVVKNQEFELTLVYPNEGGEEGKVSILAPLGSALLGLAVGHEIEWPLPSGQSTRIRVLEILHQPEAAGDYES